MLTNRYYKSGQRCVFNKKHTSWYLPRLLSKGSAKACRIENKRAPAVKTLSSVLPTRVKTHRKCLAGGCSVFSRRPPGGRERRQAREQTPQVLPLVSGIAEIMVQLFRPNFDPGQKGNVSLGRRVTNGHRSREPTQCVRGWSVCLRDCKWKGCSTAEESSDCAQKPLWTKSVTSLSIGSDHFSREFCFLFSFTGSFSQQKKEFLLQGISLQP